MATVDRTAVDGARQAFATARQERLRAESDLSSQTAVVSGLQRTLPANDPRLQAARTAAGAGQAAVVAARSKEKAAASATTSALAAFLSDGVPGDVARLDSSQPIVLMPVRLETRFVAYAQASPRSKPSPQLLVRIYPDEICADSHEPELSAAEQTAGQAYWAAAQPGGEQLAAWQVLLQTYPAERAAWIVRASAPATANSTPPISKPPGWSRAVEARLLPDRYVVIATRGAVTRQATGAPIVDPLALSVGPDSLSSDQAPIGPDGTLLLDDAVRWTVDFDAAVASGMAIRLPIGGDDLQLGFDRVIVIGVKTSLDEIASSAQLAALFDAQHYTSGLAFLRQGTPTSNAAGTPAAFPPADQNGQQSFAVERGAALDTGSECAAQMMTAALGLPAGTFTHVAGADLSELIPARQMNRALYSSTLGYFLDQILSPLIGSDAVNEVGQIFSQWVVPRGMVPAFRIGRVPYGVLPATSVARWQDDAGASPVQQRLAQLLRQLRPIWVVAASQAPHVGRSSDPDQDLLDVLSMDASARQVRVRRVVGNGTWLNLLSLFNFPDAQWDAIHKSLGAAMLSAAGIGGAAHPRVLDMNFSSASNLYVGALVDTETSSETTFLGARDYLSWIRTATIDQLRLQSLPASFPASVKQVLLYRFLRHGALAEYHWWGNQLLAQYSTTAIAAWSEPELVKLVPGTEAVQTPWERLQSPVSLPSVGTIDLAAFFDGDFELQIRALTGVGDFRDALGVLAALTTAELERLFTESLDSVSHRLDAWISSLANRRLMRLRQDRKQPMGCFVGAYGWVENLRPQTSAQVMMPDGTSAHTAQGGYVHSPSMAHAMTAAVLRNAYLTHLDEGETPYSIDLSSAQVRMGRFILDSVRNGQPVGAVLGYLIERGLHEVHGELLIDPIRQVAPLVANQLSDEASDPVETVAARNVVDGLALRNRWKAGTLFGAGGLLPTIAHRDLLEQELGKLDRNVDGVADLLLAELVHQVVIGSTAGSGAGLDALAQGVRPPDPAVSRGVTGGVTLTHRLAIVLGQTPPPPAPGWPAAPTSRAACEPRLDAWVGKLLGDPHQVRCRVQYSDGAAMQTIVVTMDQLQLCPLDWLALANSVSTSPSASELDRRVLDAAFGETVPANAAPDTSFTIVYAADAAWDRATTRSVPELLDLANAIGHVVGGMRPLTAADVAVPQNASDAQPQTGEALGRTQVALAALQAIQTALGQAIGVVATQPTAAQATALRTQLRSAAQFGVAAAYPAFITGGQEGGLSPLSLLDQANHAAAEIASRLTQASGESDPAARARALFGRDFRLLVGFQFPTVSAAGAELQQALAYGPQMLGAAPHPIDRWLTGATRVREALGRFRLARILAEASGATPLEWNVAQLPHDPAASWIALPPNAGEVRSSGKVSLLLHAPGGAADLQQPGFGLLVDDWVETIPNASEHTGISFRYPDTAGEAAQTILVAVSPTTASNWDFDSLAAIVNETLDNAKLRALDLQSLDGLAQLIPGIFLAANAGDETISTQLTTRLDAQLVKEEL